MMQQLLENVMPPTHPQEKHDTDCKQPTSSCFFINKIIFNLVSVEDKKVKTLESILKAKSKVKNELAELKDRLQLAKETIQKFRDQVQNLQLGNASVVPN